MKIYVGRWDLLPADWPEIELRGLYEKTEAEIKAEVQRQRDYLSQHAWDARVAEYRPDEFEAEFNEDIDCSFRTDKYWIKIF